MSATIAKVLKDCGLCASTSDAIRKIKEGAVKVNGTRVEWGRDIALNYGDVVRFGSVRQFVYPPELDERIKALAHEVAAEFTEQTAHVNVLGAVEEAVVRLLPVVLQVLKRHGAERTLSGLWQIAGGGVGADAAEV
jgi:ribosome-associated protein YbcJ (S4-like RNA binding protein)